MSPEQAQGDEIDASSDCFSLGVVLYQLLTGQLPFSAEREAAILYKITHEDPAPLSNHRNDLVDGFQRVVDKALAKDRHDRYCDASALLDDLNQLAKGDEVSPLRKKRFGVKRALTIGAVVALVIATGFIIRSFFIGMQSPPTMTTSGGDANGRKMIAVLPFVNLGTADEEYFADGVTDEITARLAVVDGLGVIARTSAKMYKGTDKAIRQIAEELGVDYVLEGTVRWQRNGDVSGESTVRVTPELTDMSDGRPMWAGAYEQDLKEIFQVRHCPQSRYGPQCIAAGDGTRADR
jgi:TolB-like protein